MDELKITADGHPDHIAISLFSQAACIRAEDSSFKKSNAQSLHIATKFYYMINANELAVNFAKVFGDIRMKLDGADRINTSWEDWAYTTIIDGSN